MELKTGYKRTEAGIVPADWLDCTVGDLIKFEGGSQPDKSHFKQSWIPGYTRLIQIRDYKSNKYETYVPSKLVRRFCEESDIMIGRYGPPVFQILKGISGAYNVALIKATPASQINKEYAYYFLKQDSLFTFIDKLSQRSSGQTGVDLKELRAYPLSLPPTQVEQEAIAEALSDADALIESLDQLITKKRQIKQGAMQELLSGKRRLPGFSDEWKVKTFGELFTFSGGYSASRDQLSTEGYCYLHYGDIHGSTKSSIDAHSEYLNIPKLKIPLKQVSPSSLLKDGDVVFVDASEDYDGTSRHIVVVNKGNEPFISGLHTIVAKSKTNELVNEYKQYCFKTPSIHQQFHFYAVGTKVSGISKTNISKLTLPIPSSPEQVAIAAILSDMDAELVALESRLAKARSIKQGMMQELLTGRIRLL
ncbi:restriction endonuclease subunit S [Comamonas aquatica]|jgi:type I restriction enzyme S subunit|uniref:restriction endonuclease subunit S n=1 Tax=Comamonas aquatica TaxID=225991 RepID=UPI00244A8FA2|nr:restriction endonuclease subunit S [Comamonas aquatica]MDH0202704.1 restriction endonuclease subunit S [Comamonas aquatica]MDH0373310.1 restriction endonuclease subunit S [Comamonas aquatica]MDH1447253.1 restriction endonuclease subunit S [Comamonas aquatica]